MTDQQLLEAMALAGLLNMLATMVGMVVNDLRLLDLKNHISKIEVAHLPDAPSRVR